MELNYNKIKTVLLAASTAIFSTSAAYALTVKFDTYVSGDDLGVMELATLDAVQNGSNVDFNLSATFNAQPSSYIDYLRLNYDGVLLSTAANIAGVAFQSFGSGAQTDASYMFNIKVDYTNSNSGGGALRLNPGEFSSFSIANVSLGLFDFSSHKSLLHVNALTGGGSTKYTSTPIVPTPVPASLPLLLAGIFCIGAISRRRRRS